MQASNPMDLVSDSSINTETLPLLSTGRKLLVKRKNKYVYLRYLARIATPINDSISGYLITNLMIPILNDFSYLNLYNKDRVIFNTVFLGNPLLFVFLSSLNEIKTSYKLSSGSEFVIGSSDFEHIRLFMARLEEILGEVHGNEYENLKLLEIALKTQGKYEEAKILLNDFKLASLYNFIRRQAEDFSNYLMTINILFAIFFSRNYDFESNWKILLKALSVATPIWLLKIIPDIMEGSWSHYESKWQGLPIFFKKFIIGLRKIVNFLFNLTFSYGTELIAVGEATQIFSTFCSSSPLPIQELVLGAIDFSIDIRHPEYYAGFLIFISSTILYPLSQLLPYFKPGCMGKTSKNIKRGMYSLFHAARITSLLLILLPQLFCFDKNTDVDSDIPTAYIIFSIIFTSCIGLLITANNTLNYKPASAEKMNVVASTTLRELENSVAGDLDQVTTNYGKISHSQIAQDNNWSKRKLFSFWKRPSVNTVDADEVIRASINEDAENETVNIVSTKHE